MLTKSGGISFVRRCIRFPPDPCIKSRSLLCRVSGNPRTLNPTDEVRTILSALADYYGSGRVAPHNHFSFFFFLFAKATTTVLQSSTHPRKIVGLISYIVYEVLVEMGPGVNLVMIW